MGSPVRRSWTLAGLDRESLHALWFDGQTRRWEAVPWPVVVDEDAGGAGHVAGPRPQAERGRGAPWTSPPEPPPDLDHWLEAMQPPDDDAELDFARDQDARFRHDLLGDDDLDD